MTNSYTYDANGNQAASSAGQALTYNGADQTTSRRSGKLLGSLRLPRLRASSLAEVRSFIQRSLNEY